MDKARPWYVSFTAIWKLASSGYQALEAVCNDFSNMRAFNHLPVEKQYWHFTILPLLRIEMIPDNVIAQDLALSYLNGILRATKPDKVLDSALCVQAYEVTVFDSGMCIQFKSKDGGLSALRDSLRGAYEQRVNQLVSSENGVLTELEPRNTKNAGDNAYGSIARALTEEKNTVRWKKEINPPIDLCFENTYLLVSDQYLSNPAAHDDAHREFFEFGEAT